MGLKGIVGRRQGRAGAGVAHKRGEGRRVVPGGTRNRPALVPCLVGAKLVLPNFCDPGLATVSRAMVMSNVRAKRTLLFAIRFDLEKPEVVTNPGAQSAPVAG